MTTDTDHTAGQPSRRSFLNAALGTAAAVFTASLVYPLARFLWPPEERPGSEGRLGIPEEDLLAGQSRVVSLRGEPVLVIREQNRVVALSAVCTHLGCLVKYRGGGVIECPCHAASFDLSGNVTGGPAPRPLPSYPVLIEGNRIVVG
ncbi:MAG: ubiquinol-cytochrome c reductase iron-sulfur subunit [Deltaproteobacteria bacterium]|nr:ubiquinol-cytochrome c reductase iron-sulfur subunit [Deltaproteobacteria bacterium]